MHIKPCSLQTVNNYQTAFESRVKKKPPERLAARNSRTRKFREKKKGKGTKVNEKESKDNACATFDGRSIFRNGPSERATSRRMHSRGIAPIGARLPKRV